MGAPAARIGAEDFLIPSELSAYRLASNGAGRIGGVRLELTARDGATRLGACYQQVPLRVLPPFHFAAEPAALLYLLNPTAGLLDGDGHLIEIRAASGVRAVVTGQSANRIHPAVSGLSTQQWRVRVESGAILAILPGPTIPFRGCRYYQHVEIDLAEDARLIWGDIWLPGRYARGRQSELFAFEQLVQYVQVRRAGRLVFRDRFHWRGPWDDTTVRWHLGEHQATASLFATGPVEGGSRWTPAGVACANLPLASGDTCLRWGGTPAEVTAALVTAAMGQAAEWTGGSWPWLLESKHLAPNHWFSVLNSG